MRWLLLVGMFLVGCGGSGDRPATPVIAPEDSVETADSAQSPPEAPPPKEATIVGYGGELPTEGKACSIWSGGPLGDAAPPADHTGTGCAANEDCICNAQAGYSCSGFCVPRK